MYLVLYCDLIGSSRGPDFPISAHERGNARRVFVLYFKFSFFDTEFRLHTEVTFYWTRGFKYDSNKIFLFETFSL